MTIGLQFIRFSLILSPVCFATHALAALPSQLTANTHASAVGGCNNCGQSQDQTLLTTTNAPLSSSAVDKPNGGPSFADASVTTEFGTQRAYADAFLAAGDRNPDAQANAFSRYVEYFAPGSFNGVANLTFLITGSHTPAADIIGPSADAELNWQFIDVTTNFGIGSGSWSSTDAPPTPIFASYAVAPGHGTSLVVDFSVSAYAQPRSNPFLVFADYSNTVHTYLNAGVGAPDVIGQSGHDYAQPTVAASVPETTTWAMMLIGFGVLGAATRRQVTAQSAPRFRQLRGRDGA